MKDLTQKTHALLASGRDYWSDAVADLHPLDPNALLPGSRTLPDFPAAREFVPAGRTAYEHLFAILRAEESDSLTFKNALFLLMYFDSLFVYRALKEIYKDSAQPQRKWLDAACRKTLIRCVEYPESGHEALTREIPRNTYPRRLATTPMLVALAAELQRDTGRTTVIRDMAVADAVTSLDVAEAAAQQGIPVSITATDIQLYLYFAKLGDDRAVSTGNRTVTQYEIDGRTYGTRHDDVPPSHLIRKKQLDETLASPAADRINMLAPEVELAEASGRYDISFKEEDASHPDPDISGAHIIRVANLFVERTPEHRGYFYRADMVQAIAQLGIPVKDGAYLFVDSFIQKLERVGKWRKDASSSRWIRLPTPTEIPEVLNGIADIDIPKGTSTG